MRVSLAMLALLASTAGALAQDRSPAQTFDNLRPVDAARMNQAVQGNPQARQALDKVEGALNQHGHKAGQMLEKTRP
jgi:Skp family chaperone for outer membrane proteins